MDNTAVPRKRSLKNPPLRIDFTAMGRRSLDMSPSRSSVQSSQIHTPSSSVPSTPLVLTRAPSPDKCPLRPRDSSTFLTALATEERRVLELKEELQKAEGELEKLKKQWASHEAAKKKNELRHLEQLQPLQPSLAGTGLSDDNESRITPRDLDRRQMAPFPVKNPQRTVFSGSRHARTLSLLSPKDSPTDLSVSSRGLRPPRGNRNDGGIIKAKATTHELSISTDGINDSDQPYRGPPKDMILETGKQLVGDFRQGLWTFFEDLKQVTVGDEAAGVSDPRCQHTFSAENLPKTQARRKGGSIVKKSPARKGKRLDLESSARHPKTESFLIHEPSNRLNVTPTIVSAVPTSLDNTSIGNTNCNSSDSDDDDWDEWDTVTTKGSTPRRKPKPYTGDAMSSPLTDNSSPRTSTSSIGATPRPKRSSNSTSRGDDLPWSSLTKLSPGRLTSTASTLMSEWEKSLAPPANNKAKSGDLKAER